MNDTNQSAEKVERLIVDALDRLPDTADGVASYLAERGIKGVCSNAERCAISEYLIAELPNDVSFISTDGGTVSALYAPYQWTENVAVPQHVSDFIGRFDCRRYPALIAADGS